MRAWHRFRQLWLTWCRPAGVERQLDDELHDWVETLAAGYEREGVAPDEARRRARLDLGGVTQRKDEARELRNGRQVDSVVSDIRQAWRALWRAPAVTLAVVLTFALGAGANTAVFTLVKAVLFEPLPYRDPDRLLLVWADLTDLGYPHAPLSGPELVDFARETSAVEVMGGIWATTGAVSGEGDPEQIRMATVTADFFAALGATPVRGRVIGGDDFGAPVRRVVISESLWTRRYGRDEGLIGRRITLNDRPAEVIGVMPAGFAVLMPRDAAVPDDIQLWAPGTPRLSAEARGQQYLRVVARLRPGVSVSAAADEIAAVGRRIVAASPEYSPGYRFYAVPMLDDNVAPVRRPLLVLMGGTTLLLALACVNLAGLLIVRASSRQRETAIRLALGAGRGRISRQYLIEGLWLALMGGVAGVGVAIAAVRALVAAAPASIPRVASAAVDRDVVWVAAMLSAACGIVLSVWPLTEALRGRALSAVQGQSRATAATIRPATRAALIIGQVAVSVVLLIGAGLLASSFQRLLRVDPGFRAEGVLTFRVAPPYQRYPSLERQAAVHRALIDALRGVAGVGVVGAISHVPYDSLPNWGTPYLPPGETNLARAGLADARTVDPGALDALGGTMIHGRWFTEADGPGDEVRLVVDELFAAHVWPGVDPVGRVVRLDAFANGTPDTDARVIGVVRHLRHRALTEVGREQVFVSSRQVLRNPVAYLVRVDGDPRDAAAPVRRAVASVDPRLPVYDVRPLADYVSGARTTERFVLYLAGLFAFVAFVLAAVGVYALVAYAATQQQRELGLRLALGGRPWQVAQAMVAGTVRHVAAGLVIGTSMAFLTLPVIRMPLFATAPREPVPYALAAGAVALAALAAAAWPAWRMVRRQPLDLIEP